MDQLPTQKTTLIRVDSLPVTLITDMPSEYGSRSPVCLNVAEKPSVARALAGVFARLDGARDRGMRQDAHQVFTHENVRFPSVFQQGHGNPINGPSR